MYTPANLRMPNSAQALDFIEQHGFAALVSADLTATHLPLLLARDEGEQGVLYGHVAKANPQAVQAAGQTVLAVFSGPHAYISPTWYTAGPAVPTWNYAAVHVYGRLELLDSHATLELVQRLTEVYEPGLNANHALLAPDYVARLNQAIVGFKLVIERIEGKEKLGQTRTQADQQGVYHALVDSAHLGGQALAAYMRQRRLGTGEDA